MKTHLLLSLGAAVLVLAGCKTQRSISDSGYRPEGQGHRAVSPEYVGELNELDVLGIERNAKITEEQINQALATAGQVKLRKGSRVLLVQSGARSPDEPMVAGLNQSLVITPFSGLPNEFERDAYHKALRLAAARGGCETIVCYWGMLECARQSLDSKAVSWVPIAGSFVPDEHQHMRIRLKVAIVDVRTGNWAMFSPEAFEDKALSARLGRERSDQAQVNKLKQQAYATAAQDLLKIYAN
ncbi:MAG TPA: aminopeptidase [Verrucomicrobiae bacterium]|jgi:hypothetical protein